jgi:hypothetical protein
MHCRDSGADQKHVSMLVASGIVNMKKQPAGPPQNRLVRKGGGMWMRTDSFSSGLLDNGQDLGQLVQVLLAVCLKIGDRQCDICECVGRQPSQPLWTLRIGNSLLQHHLAKQQPHQLHWAQPVLQA